MILVTGGTGLVGAQLLFDLTKKGYDVKATIRKSSNKTIVNQTFKNKPELYAKINWVNADLLNSESIYSALDDIDIVYHSAAFVSFDHRVADKVIEVNITGTANLVNACLEKGIKRFCHFSSVAALGEDKKNGKITEESALTNTKNNSTYAISKHGAEREVWRAHAEGLNAYIISPTIILGRGDWKNGSSALFNKVYSGFPYYTDGSSGFVDVRDVSNIAILLMEKNITGEKYIICAENVSYKILFSMVAVNFNRRPPYIKPPKWVNRIFWRVEYFRSSLSGHPPMITRETVQSSMQQRVFSNLKVKNELNYEFIPIKKSIEDTCKLFMEDLKEK